MPAVLVVIGDGPQRSALERRSAGLPVCFTGFLPTGSPSPSCSQALTSRCNRGRWRPLGWPHWRLSRAAPQPSSTRRARCLRSLATPARPLPELVRDSRLACDSCCRAIPGSGAPMPAPEPSGLAGRPQLTAFCEPTASSAEGVSVPMYDVSTKAQGLPG
jgi:hypothetical protein